VAGAVACYICCVHTLGNDCAVVNQDATHWGLVRAKGQTSLSTS
jgi:hypothetical protein